MNALHNDSVPIFVVEQKINDAKVTLPVSPATENTYKVILVGAKRSGKTTYVQAFLHQLENQFAQRFGSVLVASADSVAAKFRLNGLHEFLDSGKLPLSTPSARSFGAGTPEKENDPRIPIKFEFLGGTPPFRSIELFDVAGEDMDKLDDIRLYSKELAEADLVVYLFDPLQEPNIAAVLNGVIAIPERGTNPFDVLVNLSEVLADAPNRNPRQKVAVAISKFDGLVSASALTNISHPFQSTVSNGMSVTRDPNAWDNKKMNEIDSWQVHQEVRALLSRVPTLNPFITAARDRFGADRMRFFVASALGHSTFAEQINRAGITSYRVLDPLLWLVSQTQPKPE
jgi:GTPase SAR1 family protein